MTRNHRDGHTSKFAQTRLDIRRINNEIRAVVRLHSMLRFTAAAITTKEMHLPVIIFYLHLLSSQYCIQHVETSDSFHDSSTLSTYATIMSQVATAVAGGLASKSISRTTKGRVHVYSAPGRNGGGVRFHRHRYAWSGLYIIEYDELAHAKRP